MPGFLYTSVDTTTRMPFQILFVVLFESIAFPFAFGNPMFVMKMKTLQGILVAVFSQCNKGNELFFTNTQLI